MLECAKAEAALECAKAEGVGRDARGRTEAEEAEEAAEAAEAEEAGGDKIKEKLWRIGAGTVTLFIWKRVVTSSARRALRRLAARSAKGRFNNNENCFF